MSLCPDIVNHRQSRYPRIYPAIIEKCRNNHTDHGAELAFAKIVRRNLPLLQVFLKISTEQISKQNLIEYIMQTLSTLFSSWYKKPCNQNSYISYSQYRGIKADDIPLIHYPQIQFGYEKNCRRLRLKMTILIRINVRLKKKFIIESLAGNWFTIFSQFLSSIGIEARDNHPPEMSEQIWIYFVTYCCNLL